MLAKFHVDEVLATRLLEDGSGVTLAVKSGEDAIELTIPAHDIASIFQVFADLMRSLEAMKLPADAMRVQARFPDSVAVAGAKNAARPVAMIFDKGRATASAYALSTDGARALGHNLLRQVREAETAASRAVRPAAVQPLGARS